MHVIEFDKSVDQHKELIVQDWQRGCGGSGGENQHITDVLVDEE